MKEAKSAYFPTLRMHAYPRPSITLWNATDTALGSHRKSRWANQLQFGLDGIRRRCPKAHPVAGRARRASSAGTGDGHARSDLKWRLDRLLRSENCIPPAGGRRGLLDAATQSYDAAIQSYHYGFRSLLDVTEAQKLWCRQGRQMSLHVRRCWPHSQTFPSKPPTPFRQPVGGANYDTKDWNFCSDIPDSDDDHRLLEAPAVDVMGSLFPAWLLCIALGQSFRLLHTGF